MSRDDSDIETINLFDDVTRSSIEKSLNRPITFFEVKNMIRKLKHSKSPGLDMICAELLKNPNDKFVEVFVALFNIILKSGEFPEEWAIGIVVLIFKGGDKSKLDNYRAITLLSIFSKLFIRILLERLIKIVCENKILHENQIAFSKNYQTSDHIFTLCAIIENPFQNKKGAL